jgi:prepilin-type N-terminal cleavage/methylation domain-containing protein
MVSSRTLYLVRHTLCLMRQVQYGIGRTQHLPSCCDSEEGRCHLRPAGSGFTVVELLIVVVIVAIAALTAIPMMISADSFQIRSAANMVAADLEYAKTIAISRDQCFSVVFDKAAESYRIEDESGAVIAHPVKKGFDYIIDFQNDSGLNKVDIEDVDFDPDSGHTITFDYLGSPYSGSGTSNPLNSGVVSLRAGQITVTVNIEPVTGFISIVD